MAAMSSDRRGMDMISKKLWRGAALGVLAAAAAATLAFAQTSAPADTPPAPASPALSAPTTTPAPDAANPAAPPAPPPSAAVAPTMGPQSTLPHTGYASTNLNLRSGPGTDNAILATIPAASAVRIMSCSGEWCAVQWNGRDGYAVARNLGATKPRLVRRYVARPYYEPGPPVVYGAPVYYYRPYYYYGPRFYYRRGWGWHRRW